jgi:hypothetical protein
VPAARVVGSGHRETDKTGRFSLLDFVFRFRFRTRELGMLAGEGEVVLLLTLGWSKTRRKRRRGSRRREPGRRRDGAGDDEQNLASPLP